MIKVYKVKNLKTGMFRTAGGSWSRTGKTWNNLGHLKSSIAAQGFYGQHSPELPSDDIVIIEVVIQETEANVRLMSDLIENERRLQELAKKYGESFSELVKRIEEQGQTDQFKWVLCTNTRYSWDTKSDIGGLSEMMEIIKKLKLKQNKDFKKASTYNGGAAVAFASKQHAAMVRLSMTNKVTGVDIQKYIETNLDDKEDDALNSST